MAYITLHSSLIAPIRKLTEGTRESTSFNFQKRINVNTRDELGQLAADFNIMARTIDTHIKNLRKKISVLLPDQEVISAVYGVGYRYISPPE